MLDLNMVVELGGLEPEFPSTGRQDEILSFACLEGKTGNNVVRPYYNVCWLSMQRCLLFHVRMNRIQSGRGAFQWGRGKSCLLFCLPDEPENVSLEMLRQCYPSSFFHLVEGSQDLCCKLSARGNAAGDVN